MSEPTYTIITNRDIWTIFGLYLLGCLTGPFISAVGEGIVSAIFKRRPAHVCARCEKRGMMHCGSECLGDGEDSNV